MNQSLKDARILAIDDTPLNLELLTNLLEAEGYKNYLVLEDPTKAFDVIESFKPDLILLDLMMPKVSGYDILDTLRDENKLGGKLKILVMTADATLEAKKKCLNQGAHDFLTKPFDIVEASLRIKNLLYNSYLFEELAKQNEQLEHKVEERVKELKISNQFIKKQNETLKEIAWIQSHIVRAPVSRILGLSELLTLEDSEDFSHNQIVERIVQSCQELDVIIRDISRKTDDAEIHDLNE